jgi:hypothetical protein
MAVVTAPVGSWGCPSIEVSCLDGGFSYQYDDTTFPDDPPLDACPTEAT